jgi:microcompartment protein CcmL/EutN
VNEAIGVIEFSSVARGIEATDHMLKTARVTLLKSSTVCPGKYITILGGHVENIKTAVSAGLRAGGEYVVDTLEIPNVHAQLIPAIVQSNPVEHPSAVGVMEFYSVTAGILAADAAAKAARVTLIEVKIGYAIGGKGVVLLTGELEAVKTAIRAACPDGDQLLQVSVIARPEHSLLETLL